MSNPISFHPDILEKYQIYTKHTNEKNRITNEFLSILKNICELEEFYSRNLEKLAESTSKLIMGKDTLKDVFIIFEKILKSKSDEARKVAEEIKNDMMPFIRTALNEENYGFKKMDKKTKDVKLEMEKKHRTLQFYKNSYSKAYRELNRNYSLSNPQNKEELRINYKLKENQLIDNISFYNVSVENYLLAFSELTNSFSDSEAERKRKIKSSIHKYIIYEISAIKNIEYDIDRFCKSLELMEDKLTIFEKINNGNDKISIAKVAPNNFIEYVKFDILETEKTHKRNIVNIPELKQKYLGEIDQNQYKTLLKQVYALLDYIKETKDIEDFKKIIAYGEEVYKTLPDFQSQKRKMYLIDGIFCHDIFRQREFWDFYLKKLLAAVQKETGSMSSLSHHAIYNSLQEELTFLSSFRLQNQILKDFIAKIEQEMKKLDVRQCMVRNISPSRSRSKETQPEVPEKLEINNERILVDEANKQNTLGSNYTIEQYEAFS